MAMSWFGGAVWAAAIAFVSFLLVDLARRWSEYRRHYDHPNERSSHTKPTPSSGGLGIVATVLLAMIALRATGTMKAVDGQLPLMLAAFLIAAISYIDDLRPLSAAVRLTVHFVAATIVVTSVGAWSEIALPGSRVIPLGLVGVAFTCLWIVGVTNIYNFMDGIDGIAGSQAIIGGIAWAVIGARSNSPALAIIGGLLAAATAGFLVHNWPPARIFMGDVGSAFLGFLLASLPLLSPRRAALFLPATLILWPFLADGIWTILRRLRRGENIFAAHRSHLYQRLNIAGRSHASITTIYALLAVLGAVAAVTVEPVAIAVLPVSAIALWIFVVRTERGLARTHDLRLRAD